MDLTFQQGRLTKRLWILAGTQQKSQLLAPILASLLSPALEGSANPSLKTDWTVSYRMWTVFVIMHTAFNLFAQDSLVTLFSSSSFLTENLRSQRV